MTPAYKTALYGRLKNEVDEIQIVDCHEHLERDRDFATGDGLHLGRLFWHYASCDLVSAGMPQADMAKMQNDRKLSPRERWALAEPWYRKAWNTGYCEALRIAIRDLYGIDDFSPDTADALTDALRKNVKAGFTRRVFDRAGIDFALNNLWGPRPVFNADFDPDCFIPDMVEPFTSLPLQELARDSGLQVRTLDEYLAVIDHYFEKNGRAAAAFKVGRAYDRTLFWEDVPRSAVEKTFNRLLAFNDRPDRRDVHALEDFILHYCCRKCGDYGVRMKFHTGLQEGNGNLITNSRAALLANLFMKYPKTTFDIYHISYPYQEEALTLVKNFANVTIDFCWMWIIGASAGRRMLSDLLDAVPANKIHGFGGDYLFVEGSYGHAAMARREITRVLCEKVEEGRFTEDQALTVARQLLRDNALENFGLVARRREFRKLAAAANRKHVQPT